jgi:F0F1-type ATP synthase assembly protein I
MNKKETSKLEKMMFSEHYKITFRVIAITISTMAILAGGGYLIDKQLETYPTIFIIGLVLAFPITQLVIYKTFKQVTDKVEQESNVKH